MTFQSILFPSPDEAIGESTAGRDFFSDLNLDQIVAAIIKGKEEYRLKAFFQLPLRDVDDIAFRHEIMRDLEDTELIDNLRKFAEVMRSVRAHIAQFNKQPYKAEKERWFLDAAVLYCNAVTGLLDALSASSVASRGLKQFHEFGKEYVSSEHFLSLHEEADQIQSDLNSIKYNILVSRLQVAVRPSQDGANYSTEIEDLFDRFRQGDVEPFAFKQPKPEGLSKVESTILDRVANMNPEAFNGLDAFCRMHRNFLNKTIADFDREIQFYIAYLEHIGRLRQAGLNFCYPKVSRDSKESYSIGGFDMALAHTQIDDDRGIVSNDFELSGRERIVVVTGPNQGGKTTFARAFGQTHYLASLGCPVPGKEARLPICDMIFTHFEKQEDIVDLSGKLKDDLIRVHAILDEATSRSLVIVNEIFSSTSLRDATALSRKIADQFIELDLLGLWVTFVDELSTHSDQTVSMVSSVDPGSPAQRTFRIVRRPADGLAYALSIAEKHRLTRDLIEKRLST